MFGFFSRLSDVVFHPFNSSQADERVGFLREIGRAWKRGPPDAVMGAEEEVRMIYLLVAMQPTVSVIIHVFFFLNRLCGSREFSESPKIYSTIDDMEEMDNHFKNSFTKVD